MAKMSRNITGQHADSLVHEVSAQVSTSRIPVPPTCRKINDGAGQGFEYELLDTGVFEDDRYFDLIIEYAKTTTEDICIRIEAINRGPELAHESLVPKHRSWGAEPTAQPVIQPEILR